MCSGLPPNKTPFCQCYLNDPDSHEPEEYF